MFDFYLPITEVTINIPLLLIISAAVGFLTGLLGIGGGFLMTPILIFLGIPPIYAVANGANNIVAASVSGSLAHYFKNHIDIKMGLLILTGGLIGSIIGVEIFIFFLKKGTINNIISISYFVLLSSIGLMMFYESLSEMKRIRNKKFIKRKIHQHYWIHNLPFKVRIHASKLYISAIGPIFFGIIIGLVSSLLGVGGGFLLVPILIYIIGMPAKLVPGTSLFAMIFVMVIVTLLHGISNNTIDIYLVIILAIGSVFGAQLGSVISSKLAGEELRGLMSILILTFGFKFGYDLFFSKILPSIDITNISHADFSRFTNFVVISSQNYPIIYGITSVSVAILIGILVAYSFKKIIK
ncbi:MAG: sulfite exporter TauE/SafE family protein [Pelagibacteraceae bacterium]|nr:sulfite exporter TauE/SafE family protein [Pelagibacteraceae bacterium]MCI5078772.1 sulfite exporter TauE/SafE family protein [Pelagibacteraceae bacterium]